MDHLAYLFDACGIEVEWTENGFCHKSDCVVGREILFFWRPDPDKTGWYLDVCLMEVDELHGAQVFVEMLNWNDACSGLGTFSVRRERGDESEMGTVVFQTYVLRTNSVEAFCENLQETEDMIHGIYCMIEAVE